MSQSTLFEEGGAEVTLKHPQQNKSVAVQDHTEDAEYAVYRRRAGLRGYQHGRKATSPGAPSGPAPKPRVKQTIIALHR